MIKVIASTSEFLSWRQSHQAPVALVPTMGNLHLGHVSLVAEAAKNYKTVIVTIFVNPKQFGPNEDFARYPRTLADDLKALESIAADIIIFAPKDPKEIYPDGFASEITVPSLAQILCGKTRPTHFNGVTTVVYQLFSLAQAQSAYFGLKDYQQFQIIKRMCVDLRLNIKLVGMPIVRDHDGLALSSRNRYLSPEQRQQALELPQSLDQAQSILLDQGVLPCQEYISKQLQTGTWDYLELRNAETLQEIHQSDSVCLVAGAMFVGTTRLIDNRLVELNAR